MKGMILKDLYLSWKYYKPYLLISLFFIVISFWTDNNIFMLCYPLMFVGMIPMGLQNMDESYKWDMYCGSLPVTKRQMVSQKYMIGLLFTLPVSMLTLLAKALEMVINGDFQWAVLGMLALVSWILGLMTSALSLPLLFKFGSEKGRVAQYLIIGVVCGLSALVGIRTSGKMPGFSGDAGALLVMLLLPLGLYVGSWWLSVKVYEKREIR